MYLLYASLYNSVLGLEPFLSWIQHAVGLKDPIEPCYSSGSTGLLVAIQDLMWLYVHSLVEVGRDLWRKLG